MKKRLLFLLLTGILFISITACKSSPSLTTPDDLDAETPKVTSPIPLTPKPTDNAPSESGEVISTTPAEEPESKNDETVEGWIVGDMFYKDINIALLFEEPFLDVLGDPLSERGPYFFYDDLEVTAEWDNTSSSYKMAEQIQSSCLFLFEINEITFDKTRADLISFFGKPIFYSYPDSQYYNPDDPDDYHWLGYHISLYSIEYRLEFWFDHPDTNAYSFSLRPVDW